MRVRTAMVKATLANGLEPLFTRAVDRNLAWLVGQGRVYADLERVAGKAGYRVWTRAVEGDHEAGLWVAVRENLIAEGSWTTDEMFLSFEPTRERMGTVTLVGENLFDWDSRVRLLSESEREVFDNFEYAERLYSVTALQD